MIYTHPRQLGTSFFPAGAIFPHTLLTCGFGYSAVTLLVGGKVPAGKLVKVVLAGFFTLKLIHKIERFIKVNFYILL